MGRGHSPSGTIPLGLGKVPLRGLSVEAAACSCSGGSWRDVAQEAGELFRKNFGFTNAAGKWPEGPSGIGGGCSSGGSPERPWKDGQGRVGPSSEGASTRGLGCQGGRLSGGSSNLAWMPF